MIWSVIGYTINSSKDEYLIGHIRSLTKETRTAAEKLGKDMCHRKGYFFKEIVEGDVLEHRHFTIVKEA